MELKLKLTDYRTDVHNNWCPGCGDFGILSSIQQALFEMQLNPSKVAIISGIGCSAKTPHYINGYGIHTLHGRAIPYATGLKLANPELEVIVTVGDGDGLGIGAGHFVHAGRRNVDFTVVLYNNEVYGLTKGQAAPTLNIGVKTKSLPKPNINQAINPILLAFAAGYTFIARGYAYEVKHLKELIKQAISHKGSAFVEVIQPCPTYNDIHTKEYWSGKGNIDPKTGKEVPRYYKLEETGYECIITDETTEEEYLNKITNFIKKAYESGNRVPIGVFYRDLRFATYEERLSSRMPTYKISPPAKQEIADKKGNLITNIDKILEEFAI